MDTTLLALFFLATTLLAFLWATAERDARREQERREQERQEQERREQRMAQERAAGNGGYDWLLVLVILVLLLLSPALIR